MPQSISQFDYFGYEHNVNPCQKFEIIHLPTGTHNREI